MSKVLKFANLLSFHLNILH